MAIVSAIQEAQKNNLKSLNDYMMKVMDKLATTFKSAYDSLGLETSGGKSANIQKIWYLMQTLMGEDTVV